jgi:hypothetical protein
VEKRLWRAWSAAIAIPASASAPCSTGHPDQPATPLAATSPPHAWVKDWLDHTGPDPEFRIHVSDLYCLPSCASARFFSTSDKPAAALPLSAAGALAAHQRHELLALNPGAERQIKRSGAAAPPLPGRLVATEVVVLSPSRDLRVHSTSSRPLETPSFRSSASRRAEKGTARELLLTAFIPFALAP